MKITPPFFIILLCIACGIASASETQQRVISKSDLRDAIEGYWIGQLAGNYIGFPFENMYQDEPMPLLVKRYYTWKDAETEGLLMNLEDRRAYLPILADALGGSWSDDDSDIEFVYLHAVESHGLDLNYEQVREAWMNSINRFVWGGNAVARKLMDEGLIPPATGSKANSSQWYRISSQLTTEIWGVFYPGMTKQGGDRAVWAARISTDDWATHPDLFFGTLFSAGYFEKDMDRLIELGRNALPEDSPFREGIDLLVQWHEQGLHWREARKGLHERYYHQVGDFVVPAPEWGAIINGLAGVLAMLYGEGDWLETVAIATAAGYDCDNQAATCGALMGLIHGAAAIPRSLTHEMPSRSEWSEAFNDTYINYSRDGLPAYNRNSDIIDRILAVAGQAIVRQGGKLLETADGEMYEVVTDF
ncbi:MAG: ADP-ribosylglycohydrolase family protein [Puniceicoccaceae bacterium]